MLPVKSSVSFKSYLPVVLPFSALLYCPPVDSAVPLLFLAEIPGGLWCKSSPLQLQLGADRFQPLCWPVRGLVPLQSLPLSAGTSPHAPTSVHVVVAMTSANVSWEPGYDGGYEQTFSVWYGPL